MSQERRLSSSRSAHHHRAPLFSTTRSIWIIISSIVTLIHPSVVSMVKTVRSRAHTQGLVSSHEYFSLNSACRRRTKKTCNVQQAFSDNERRWKATWWFESSFFSSLQQNIPNIIACFTKCVLFKAQGFAPMWRQCHPSAGNKILRVFPTGWKNWSVVQNFRPLPPRMGSVFSLITFYRQPTSARLWSL